MSNAVSGSWTGTLTDAAGALRITSSAAIPSGQIIVSNNQGAAVQLANNVTIPNSINLNSAGNFIDGGINTGGNVESFSGTNTILGPLVTFSGDCAIGSDSGSLLNIFGGVQTTVHQLTFVGGGNFNISGSSIGSLYEINKYGTGTVTMQTTAGSISNGGIQVFGGNWVFSGSGGKMTTAGGSNYVDVWPGATLTLSDSAAGGPVANRLDGNVLNLIGGTFNYVANGGSASSESLGASRMYWGGSTINLINNGSANATLSFASFNANGIDGGAAVNFNTVGGSLGSATNKITFATTYPTLTGGIIPRATVTTNGTLNFATTSANGIVPFSAYNTSNNLDAALATDTLQLTGGTNSTLNYSKTVNALCFNGSGITLNAAVPGQQLVLTSGNILVGGGADAIGGNLVSAFGTEAGLLINAGASLNFQGPISTASNITTGPLGGNLTFSAPVYQTANWLTLNSGTTTLAAGNQTFALFSNSGVAIGPGTTLDLNGTIQTFNDFRAPNGATQQGSGGIVTSSSAGGVLVTQGNTAFAGQITGNLSLGKFGNTTQTLAGSNSYNGPTFVVGGAFTLTDYGVLANTSSLTVGYATFTMDNTGLTDLSNRVNLAAPVILNGGNILYKGRAQTASAQSLGALVLGQGVSNINMSNGGTGVNSSDLTFSSINLSNMAATVNIQTANGQMGSASRLLFTTPPTVTNNIVSPQIEDGGNDFMTYVPGLGLALLNAPGAPGYDGTTIPAATQPTQNIRLAAAGTIPNMSGGVFSLNSLNLQANSLTFSNSTDTLNVVSGGILKNGAAVTSIGNVIGNGQITAGGTGSGLVPLYLYGNPGTLTVNSSIVNNASSGTVELVATVLQGGLLVLANTNGYTGGTVVNGWLGSAGTVNVGAAGSLPAGGLTINDATVSQAVAGNIASQLVTLNGDAILALTGNNSLTGIAFNNNGGVVAPTVTTGGILTLSGTGLTASSNNPGTTAALSGTVSYNSSPATITVNPITVNGQSAAPWAATLNVSGVLTNAAGLTVAGGGNLELGGQSTYAGGTMVNTLTGLMINGSSTPATVGSTVTSGPVGIGTLSLSNSAVLLAASAGTLANSVVLNGNMTFNGVTAATLNGTMSLTTASTITVSAPQATLTVGGVISDNGNGLTKSGYGGLTLTNTANNFSGGLTVNTGIVTASLPNLSVTPTPFGIGPITLNGGQLSVLDNGAGNNGLIVVGNSVSLGSGASVGFINVNNNGANTGNIVQFGTLSMAATQTLNVSGANGYKLAFNGGTVSGNFNVPAGMAVILNNVISTATPVNLGAGSLLFSGNNNTFPSAVTLSGTNVGAAPAVNTQNAIFGGSPVTLNNGAVMPLTPVMFGSGSLSLLNTNGYTQGGLLARFYSYSSYPALTSAANNAVPSGWAVGSAGLDYYDSNHPAGQSGVQYGTSMIIYSGLLDIQTAGVYTFRASVDDEGSYTIDNQLLNSQIGNGVGGLTTVYLTAGYHSIVSRTANSGGPGNFMLEYGGPDTVANGLAMETIPASQLYYPSSPSAGLTLSNSQNAAMLSNGVVVAPGAVATIDNQGTELNSMISSLTMSPSSALVINNGTNTGILGIAGVLTVNASAGLSSPVLNVNTGVLQTVGGIVDNGQGIAKTGQGALILAPNVPGNFTGGLTVAGGYAQLTDPTSLGTGTTTVLFGGPTVTGTATSGSSVLSLASTTGVYAGMAVSGSGLTAGAYVVSVSSTGVTLSTAATSTVSASSLTFAANGMVDLNGQTNVTGNLVLSGSGVITAYGLIGAANGALYNSNSAAASTAAANTLTLGTSGATISGLGNITINGVVQDGAVAATTLTKNGPNTLLLNGNNTFTGPMAVAGGLLQLGTATALGSTASTNTVTVSSGATLDFNGQNVSSYLRPLSLNGTGVTGLAAPNLLAALVNQRQRHDGHLRRRDHPGRRHEHRQQQPQCG